MVNANWLIWALFSAFFAGATAILAKIGLGGVDSNLATAIRTTIVLIFAWLVALIAAPRISLTIISPRAWLFLTLSGIATGLSWLCYFRALQIGEASRVAPIDKLSIVFVLIFAALFLREKIGWQQILGAALITAGALLLASSVHELLCCAKIRTYRSSALKTRSANASGRASVLASLSVIGAFHHPHPWSVESAFKNPPGSGVRRAPRRFPSRNAARHANRPAI
jgi:transporter family protein